MDAVRNQLEHQGCRNSFSRYRDLIFFGENIPDFSPFFMYRIYAGLPGKPLPVSLNHPLRIVLMLRKDSSIQKAKLIIGRFNSGLCELYYAVNPPSETAGIPLRRLVATSGH